MKNESTENLAAKAMTKEYDTATCSGCFWAIEHLVGCAAVSGLQCASSKK